MQCPPPAAYIIPSMINGNWSKGGVNFGGHKKVWNDAVCSLAPSLAPKEGGETAPYFICGGRVSSYLPFLRVNKSTLLLAGVIQVRLQGDDVGLALALDWGRC